jgi:hypothetical protein
MFVKFNITRWMLEMQSESPAVDGYVPGKCTGKAIPLQALTGPEGSRRLRLPYFKTIGT